MNTPIDSLVKDAPRLVARAINNGLMEAPPKLKLNVHTQAHRIITLDIGNGPVQVRDDHARKFAIHILQNTAANEDSIERVWLAICEVFGVTRNALISHRRPQHLCYARHALCYYLRAAGVTLGCIGQSINRCHTGVMHSLKSFPTVKAHHRYSKLIELVDAKLNGQTETQDKEQPE